MNKEEIDNLEDYLKNKLPKIVPTIPIESFGSVDLADLTDSIRQFEKIPTLDELLRENKRLKKQLEEKDKVINEVLEIIKECKKLMSHEFDWEEQIENIIKRLERVDLMFFNELTLKQYNLLFPIGTLMCPSNFCIHRFTIDMTEEERKIKIEDVVKQLNSNKIGVKWEYKKECMMIERIK